MKNFTKIILGLTVISIGLASCDGNKKQIEVQKKIYTKAVSADDYSTALAAAYQVITLEHKSTFVDSIATLYFAVGNYYGAEKIAKEGLAHSQSKELKRIMAKSQKNLGKNSDAILTFQELMKEDPENAIDYEYSMGECYYFMEDFKNCLAYMQKVMEREQSTKKTIELVFNKQRQAVPYYLAALNTVAYVYTIAGNVDEGLKLYEQILQMMPEFALAKNNYQYALQVKEQAGKKK